MDPDPVAKATRKVRFAPKAPPKREQKLVLPKAEKNEDDLDDAKAERLLRRLNELDSKPKVERKAAPIQLPSSFGRSSYGAYKGIYKKQGLSSNGGSEQATEKEYKEPWDYYTNYPITLPMRRPYAGNPELLDKEEFGEDPDRQAYDENEINTAEELGLLDKDMENNMFFFQLPSTLPAIMQTDKSEVGEGGNSEKPATGSGASTRPSSLKSIPAGLIGKMLVYRSGVVKLKLGDTLYDVSAGVNCIFAQDAIAINTEKKHCCNLGEITKRAVVTPDVDSLLDAMED